VVKKRTALVVAEGGPDFNHQYYCSLFSSRVLAVDNFVPPGPGDPPGSTALVPQPGEEYVALDTKYPFLAPIPSDKDNGTNRW